MYDVLCFFCGSTNVSASVQNSRDPLIRSTSKPTVLWDWTDGTYYFSGAADYQVLFTNYLFSDITTVTITATNTSSKYDLSVVLKSKEPWYTPDISVSSRVINVGDAQTWTVYNLDPSKEYYILFGAPCKFTGSISKIQ